MASEAAIYGYLAEVLSGLILVCLCAYSVLGGADFGGGIWDLFARGPRRDAQREAIASAMGPVWEANHVWLIFVIVLLFSGLPQAFAALSMGLFVPFHLVIIGIVLRGTAFVFRSYGPKDEQSRRLWGAVFGAASAFTPVVLGMCLGAVSAGNLRIQADMEGLTPIDMPGASVPSWLGVVPLCLGALALAQCAYLAAVFLTLETEGELREDFRRRALFAGTFVVGLSVVLLPVLHQHGRHLYRGLFSVRALPVLLLGGACALASGLLLLFQRYHLARRTAIGQVVCLLLGFGIAQYPYLVYPDVRLHEVLAPLSTLRLVLWTLPFGLVILLPALYALFRLFKGRRG